VLLAASLGETGYFICTYIYSNSISASLSQAVDIALSKNSYDDIYPYMLQATEKKYIPQYIEKSTNLKDYYDPSRDSWQLSALEPMPFQYPIGIIFDGEDPNNIEDSLENAYFCTKIDDYQEILCVLNNKVLKRSFEAIINLLHQHGTSSLLIIIVNEGKEAEHSPKFLKKGIQNTDELFMFIYDQLRVAHNGLIYIQVLFETIDTIVHLTDHKDILITTKNFNMASRLCSLLSEQGLTQKTELLRPAINLGHRHYEGGNSISVNALPKILEDCGFSRV